MLLILMPNNLAELPFGVGVQLEDVYYLVLERKPNFCHSEERSDEKSVTTNLLFKWCLVVLDLL